MNIFCFILYVEYNAAIESTSGHLIGICADYQICLVLFPPLFGSTTIDIHVLSNIRGFIYLYQVLPRMSQPRPRSSSSYIKIQFNILIF